MLTLAEGAPPAPPSWPPSWPPGTPADPPSPPSASYMDGYWSYTGGSQLGNNGGIFGTIGVPSSNAYPSARHGSAVAWDNGARRMFIFGGQRSSGGWTDSFMNDLWSYDTVAMQWTLLFGSAATNQVRQQATPMSPTAMPGALSNATGCFDPMSGTDGAILIYGGVNQNFEIFADLWKFDISSAAWSCLQCRPVNQYGSFVGTKEPGSLMQHRMAIDIAGRRMFIHGGYGYGSSMGVMQDLWQYSIIDNSWQLLHGSGNAYQSGSWGIQGDFDSSTTPGCRMDHFLAYSVMGNRLMLFGGACQGNSYNDVWQFDLGANKYAWIGGSDSPGDWGNYCDQGWLSYNGCRPRARSQFGASFVPELQAIMVFGGYGPGYDGGMTYAQAALNDVWMFHVNEQKWRWVGGSSSQLNEGPMFDSQQRTGGRRGVAFATDYTGNRVFIFGGLGESAFCCIEIDCIELTS